MRGGGVGRVGGGMLHGGGDVSPSKIVRSCWSIVGVRPGTDCGAREIVSLAGRVGLAEVVC